MQVFELPGPHIRPQSVAFSPDGRLLAAWDYGQVFVIDTASGVARTLWDKADVSMSNVPGLGFTADGRGVIAQHGTTPNPVVRVHDPDSGTVSRELALTYGDAFEPGPGGRLVYLGLHTKNKSVEVVRWDPLTGQKQPAFGRHASYLRQLAVSADENWVAGASSDVIRVWNIAGGKRPARAVRQFKVEKYNRICSLALSLDGAFVASQDWGVQVWAVGAGERWEVATRARIDATSFCREITFHPSRPLLAFSARTAEVGFWDAAARAEVKRFAWDIGQVTATAFSADGLRCAAAGAGKVVVWDVDA